METTPDTPPILLLQQRLGEKIAVALATAFLDDTKGMLEKISECIDEKDAAAVLRLLTHKLLGISASIMDKDTNQLSRALEDRSHDQNWDTAKDTYSQLKVALTKTRETLQEYLKTHPPKK